MSSGLAVIPQSYYYEFLQRGYNAKDFGVKGDGITDDTSALQNALNAVPAGSILIIPPASYLTGSLNSPNGIIIQAYGATLIRSTNSGNPTLTLSDNSTLFGLTLNGQKGTLSGGTKSDYGLSLGNGCRIEDVTAHDFAGDGVLVQNTSTSNPTILNRVTGYNNGLTPGASGTGDGIYVLNSFYTTLENCVAYGNARNGISVTTYNATTTNQDQTLSSDVTVRNCRSYNNSYTDIDLEDVTSPRAINCEGGLSANNTSYLQVVGGVYTAISTNGDFAQVENARIYNTSHSNDLVDMTGKSPKLIGCRIEAASTVTPSSNSVTINPSDGYAEVIGNSLKNVYNGWVINNPLTHFTGNRVEGATNHPIWVRNGGSFNNAEIRSGVFYGFGTVAPTAGTYSVGDRVININPSIQGTAGSQYTIDGWICTTAGTPGTWEPMRTLTGT